MAYEKFTTIFYSALFVLGALLSLIPAFIAHKREKNFWVWWLSTIFVFALFLLIIIQTQNLSATMYLLGILFLASILASLPTSYLHVLGESLRPVIWEGLTGILIIGITLYYFLTHVSFSSSPNGTLYHSAIAFVILISGLGLASFIFALYGRSARDILTIILLNSLLLLFFLFQGWNIYYGIMQKLNLTDVAVLFDLVVKDLSIQPIYGILVLIAISSGCVALAVRLNDIFGFVPKSNRKKSSKSAEEIFAYLLLFILTAILYYYAMPKSGEYWRPFGNSFFMTLGVVFLLALLGIASFLSMYFERPLREVIRVVLLAFLLAVLLKPSLTSAVFPQKSIQTETDLGYVMTQLTYGKPIGGIFVWFGISIGCARIAIFSFHHLKQRVPDIRLSKNPLMSSCVLIGIVLAELGRSYFKWGEGTPLVLITFFIRFLLMILFGIIGFALSAITIRQLINQAKPRFVMGIVGAGLLTGLTSLSIYFSFLDTESWSRMSAMILIRFLSYCGIGSGVVSTILWFISDYRNRNLDSTPA